MIFVARVFFGHYTIVGKQSFNRKAWLLPPQYTKSLNCLFVSISLCLSLPLSLCLLFSGVCRCLHTTSSAHGEN